MSQDQGSTAGGMARWLVLFFTVLAVVVGGAVALPRVATGQGWLVPNAAPSLTPGALPTEGAGIGSGVVEPAVVPTPSTMTDPAALAAKLDAVPLTRGSVTLDGTLAAQVVDLTTGQVLYDRNATAPVTPASTLKMMTATALVDAVGPAHRFSTKVVAGPDNGIVLVGGGDPLLSVQAEGDGYPKPASLSELAGATAAVLKERGLTTVALGYDDTAFSGPSWNATWDAGYTSEVTDISALMADEGRNKGETSRSKNPSLHAAQAFIRLLGDNGVTVSGPPTAAAALPDGAPIAEVASLPVSELAGFALLESDNTVTEVLLRQLAIADGQQASFDGGVAALTTSMRRFGLWSDTMVLTDGSGLSKSNRLTAASMTGVIQLMNSREDLRPLLAGLPVGAATGTLRPRYGEEVAAAGRGQVRAKTGTLNGVGALAGYTRNRDGALVAFGFVFNGATTADPRPYLDELTATLAGCGC